MDKVILIIMMVFFVISAVDYIIGNKIGFGCKFKEGIESIGILVLSMTGIYAISPILANILLVMFKPISEFLKIDSSIFPSMFLAIDMGGLSIAKNLATNESMYIISGVIIASTLGATISFSIPLALGIVEEKYKSDLSKGFIYGIATMPISALVAGGLLQMNLINLIYNLLPLFVLSILLIIGIIKFEDITQKIFKFISKGIIFLSLIGLLCLGINSILGIELIRGMMGIEESLSVAGKIGIFLAGAYPFLDFVTKKLSKVFVNLAIKLNLTEASIINILAGMISNIIIFKNFKSLGERGRILCSAFSVSGAFVLGGQLGFVSSQASEFTNIYIISKLTAGFFSIILAYAFTKNTKKINSNL